MPFLVNGLYRIRRKGKIAGKITVKVTSVNGPLGGVYMEVSL